MRTESPGASLLSTGAHLLAGLTRALQAKMRGGLALRWSEIVAVERVAAEIAAEFDGEDPLKPALREAVEATKASIQQMAIVSEDYGGPVLLGEPSAEDLEAFRRLVERGGALFTA